eukprot:CAMPEP_0179893780 /NCGR_PEP_ID=MMETSP0982-20121206/34949_1 /TAXON_ID=483367 /ORGANISM="non described non described, Strain CCMP 2436" /LENGTH=534 /DNA_ID=CAMNT_0021790355 /DNA_START=61 /DNA_END=1666 /DNA_ORIENTATION=-
MAHPTPRLRRNVPITQLRELNEPIGSLTPRSFEACKRLGVNPQTLQPSVIEDFLDDKNTDRVVAQKKLRHAIAKRLRNIEVIELSREQWIKEQARAEAKKDDVALMEARLAGPDSSAYLELERKRLEKVEFLQAKEMERLLNGERKTAALIARNALREAADLKAREHHELERKRRMDEAAKKKQAMELEKKQKGETHLEAEKEIAAKFRNVERRKLKQELKEADKRKRESERLHAEQAAADEIRRRELERREWERHEAQQVRLEQMEMAEEAVQTRMDESKRVRAEQLLERRRKAEERIAQALADTEARQEKVLVDFERKSREAVARANANEEALRKRLDSEAREREVRTAEKRSKKDSVTRAADERAQRLVAEANDGEKVMAENKAKRDREIALRKLEHELKTADKVEICESLQRSHEYHRVMLAQKIERETTRSERIKAAREAMIRQRKANAKEQLIRKHELIAHLEELSVRNRLGVEEGDEDAHTMGGSSGGGVFWGRAAMTASFDSIVTWSEMASSAAAASASGEDVSRV